LFGVRYELSPPSDPDGPPETLSLLRVLRTALALERGARPQEIEVAPWLAGPSLRNVAPRHCIAPVLAPWREHLGLRTDDVEWLMRAQQQNTTRALAAAQALRTIVSAFTDAGIRMLTLKGLPLAMRTTGDIGGRHCGDVDVLVDPSRLDDADEVLRSLGIARRSGPNGQPFDGRYAGWVRSLSNQTVFRGDVGPSVELHWRLTGPELLPIDFQTLWDGHADLEVTGTAVSTLGATHEILFVAVHLAKHLGGRFQWVVDVERLLRDVDTTTCADVDALAAASGVGRALLVATALAAELGPSRVPLAADTKRERRVVARLSQQAWVSTTGRMPSELAKVRYGSRLSKRLRSKYSVWSWAALPVYLFDTLSLPKPLAPLYVPLRPALRRRAAAAKRATTVGAP
jgi:hypothetical protein